MGKGAGFTVGLGTTGGGGFVGGGGGGGLTEISGGCWAPPSGLTLLLQALRPAADTNETAKAANLVL